MLRDARHLDKFFYMLSESLFYEPFPSRYEPAGNYKALVQHLIDRLADGWLISRDGVWFHAHPERFDLPLQGWKVHVSATPSNGEAILRDVATIALTDGVPFKFALDENMLSLIGSKGWYRGGSGKFMTIYPPSLEVFERLLERLYSTLRSYTGPYILSDKRFKDCQVLYYRFGGIRPNERLEITGQKTAILISPDGEAVPDTRTPYFAPPPWATDPFAAEEIQSQPSEEQITLNAGKYVVKRVLAFSNSGGVYLAEDRESGTEVVIKEARANTAVDHNAIDAVARLKKEQAILELLSDTGVAPRPIESFYDWEHFFLVEEYIEGDDVRELMLTQSPLVLVRPSLDQSSRYYDTFAKIFKSFAEALTTVHAHGIVIGDVSASNIKIDPSTHTVRLVDFEGASRLGVDEATRLFTPGFQDTRRKNEASHDFAGDYYGLAAVMLYTLFPIAAFASLRHDLYEGVLKTIVSDVGWAESEVFNVINGLSNATVTSSRARELLDRPARIAAPRYDDDVDSAWCTKTSQQLAEFLLDRIEPTAKDRLFPADPFMYQTNSLSLGFGACGVLYALRKCGFELPARAYDWLENKLDSAKDDEFPPGLLTGSAGMAWCLWELGLRDRACEFMAIANRSELLKRHHSYLYGMAGIGMANLHFYLRTGEARYLTAAHELGESLLESARDDDKGLYWEPDGFVHVGYGYGQSGVALFFLRLFQLSGSERLLSAGRRALEFDFSHAVELEPGVLSFPAAPSDKTVEPYLEQGSAGIAKVALRYGMLDRTKTILPDVWRKYSTYPGLIYGLGGFVDILTDAFIYSQNDEFLEMAKRPLSGIRDLYLTKQPIGSATPGDGLFRVSCDYATGVAGVLRSLHRFVHHDESDFTLDEVAPAKTNSIHAGSVREAETVPLTEYADRT
jgi:class III lanthionine synthetase